MGHKVNPISFRLIINKNWQSRWYANKADFGKNLVEDIKIRKGIMDKLGSAAAIARIEIERRKGEIIIFIHTARPGVIIGRSGKGVEDLKNLIQKFAIDKAKIEVIEIKNPDTIASLVAQNIGWQISKRVHFKRAVKFAIDKVMQAGAKGVKIRVSGRLGGAEIARTEKYSAGSIPLSRLRANVDFAYIGALTTYGIIGVKVWIHLGETIPVEK